MDTLEGPALKLPARIEAAGGKVPKPVAQAAAVLGDYRKGIHGLLQAAQLADQQLADDLAAAAPRGPQAVETAILESRWAKVLVAKELLNYSATTVAGRQLLARLVTTIAAHGDAIIESLRPGFDQAAARLAELAQLLPAVADLNDAEAIVRVGGASSAYAAEALALCAVIEESAGIAAEIRRFGYGRRPNEYTALPVDTRTLVHWCRFDSYNALTEWGRRTAKRHKPWTATRIDGMTMRLHLAAETDEAARAVADLWQQHGPDGRIGGAPASAVGDRAAGF